MPQPDTKLDCYRDVCVLAFPELRVEENEPPVRIDAIVGKMCREPDALIYKDETASTSLPDWNRVIPAKSVIDPSSIVDLTSSMNEDGKLTWKVPAGNWTILRFGYTPTGAKAGSTPESSPGLECDKLSKAAIKFHLSKRFEDLFKRLGSLVSETAAYCVIDSFEVGMQNWTGTMPEEFRERNGYDMRDFMPVMTGRFVGNVKASESFLFDFRRTIAELFADNYFGGTKEFCQEHGLKFYLEPYGNGPFDDLLAGSRADVPMGEFWARLPTHGLGMVKVPASVAHTYGKRTESGEQIVGMEAFTGASTMSSWFSYPYGLKALGDMAYCLGGTRIILHVFVHQPHPTAVPGMTLGHYGSHFDRTSTWFDKAGPWTDYLSRCQFLLQKGNSVADVCYLIGEHSPSKLKDLISSVPVFESLQPALPEGYDFDMCNADVILSRMSVKNGQIVLPDGVKYRLLILPPSRTLTLKLLEKIHKLVFDGAHIVLGSKPEFSPSLGEQLGGTSEYNKLVSDLCGGCDGHEVTEHAFGKGKIYWGRPLSEILDDLEVGPDFAYSAQHRDAKLKSIHRRVGEHDVYFISNQKRRYEQTVCSFRVEGKAPQLWYPDTGQVEDAAVYDSLDGRIQLPLTFEPAGSVFVVFGKPAQQSRVVHVQKDGQSLLSTNHYNVSKRQVPETRGSEDITDTFAVSVWIKPESSAFLPEPSGEGSNLTPGGMTFGKGYIIFPPEGDQLYGAQNSCMGLIAGINGVCVMERSSDDVYPAVLVAKHAIEGWTHITVQYENGTPVLYVNGTFVKQGAKSGFTVHPELDYLDPSPNAPYFEGDMTEPVLDDGLLDAGQIEEQFNAGVPLANFARPLKLTSVTSTAGDQKLIAEIWQNGTYKLKRDNGQTDSFTVSDLPEPREVGGPWTVHFPAAKGAPEKITLDRLVSWIKHDHEGVRHFSGTGTYENKFRIDEDWIENNRRVYVDLGRVEVMANLVINGRDMGALWKPPYQVDITSAIKKGDNELVVNVTNLWANRLIGDEKLPPENEYADYGYISEFPQWFREGKPKPAGGRQTFATWRHFNRDSPLMESGLLGPVSIIVTEEKQF